MAAVDLTNPQTWNRYAYVNNNPLSNVDPLGLYAEENPAFSQDACTASIASTLTQQLMAAITAGFSGRPPFGASTISNTACMGGAFPTPASGNGSAPSNSSGVTSGTTLPNSRTNNKAPVCFAQLKSRAVNDPTTRKVNALHTFWWVQGSSGQRIISGGPLPSSGSNQHLSVWVNPNLYQGPDTPSAHLLFNSGLTTSACGQVDSMINAGQSFPNGSLIYDPVWGPTSNTAAKYFGDVGGFSPSFPFTAYWANAPLLVPQVP